MILSDQRILDEMELGTIKIEPYDRNCLGSNSYDVHLGKHLALYVDAELDAKKHNTIAHFEIPEEGFLLMPDQFYLGVTEEYTETHAHVPFWKARAVPVVWALIFMPLRVKAMWDFVVTGPWKYR
jgi:dCTP deaminase